MESSAEFIYRKEKQFEKEKSQPIRMKDIGRKGKLVFRRVAWTFMPQTNLDKKVFVVERFIKEKKEGEHAYDGWEEGGVEYRFGYFIVGQIGRAKDKWIWGQFCPIIPHEDLEKLLKKSKKEKTILK